MAAREATKDDKQRSYPFTINNPEGPEWDGQSALAFDPFELFNRAEAGGAKYVIYSYEIGLEGTPHCQGWVQLKSPQRMAYIHKWGGNWAHAALRVQARSDEANVKYCSKEDDETFVCGPWEFGERMEQGQRSDLKMAMDTLKETRSLKRVAEDHPETYVRYGKGIKDWLAVTHVNYFKPPPEVWYKWQQDIIDIANGPVHDRKVYWIYDHQGNNGKSELSHYMESQMGALVLMGGRHDRLQEAYQGQPIIVFDFPRSSVECDKDEKDQKDYTPYYCIEAFKNGRQHSGFYGVAPKRFKPPHVFVFANYLPDKSKLSMDRWEIIKL